MPRLPKKSFILLSAFCCAALLSAAPRGINKDQNALQSEIDAINLQLDYLKLKVSDSLKKTRNLENRIKEKKTEVTQLRSQIEQLALTQNETTVQINRLEEESRIGQAQMQILLERFKARLIQLHKIRQGTLLGSIFSAKNLNSFLNRYHMVKYLLESDKTLIEELKRRDRQQNELTAELQKKYQHLEAGKLELDEKQKKLDRENAALNAMLSTVLLEKKLFLDREKSLATARKQLEKEFSKAEASLNSPELEKELKQPVITGKKNIRPAQDPGNLSENAPEAAKIMQFSWPVTKQDRLEVQPIGEESSPALQIRVNAGTEIQAVAKGKVLYKGTISGLGDVIIIGHQRGFSTVYARLDDIWVGLNEVIEKGDTIGRISGGRNQALHFEIRFGGKKQPPLSYLPVTSNK